MKNTDTKDQLELLLRLGLRTINTGEELASVSHWSQQQIVTFIQLARDHRMILRALAPVQQMAARLGCARLAELAGTIVANESERIRVSLQCLNAVCTELELAGCPVVLFKSFDHWPDFGSDLDLCIIGDERYIVDLFTHKLHARKRLRSPGDHLAHKWTFLLRGDPTEIETHINRLGHVGEHVQLAASFIDRRRLVQVNGFNVPVPAPEERIIAAALHRMYRNLYLRVCDIVNMTALIQNADLSYRQLQEIAETAGIWPGVAAYVKIVSDYVGPYLSRRLHPPETVRLAAESIGSIKLLLGGTFFRLPVFSCGAGLFLRQFMHTLQNRDLASAVRLSLLPPLASAGTLATAITGSSAHIW